jgi:hypothetical protein
LVRAWNAATGSVAWEVNLPNENGGYQVLETQPQFSADSQTAYFGTAILAGGYEYSFLYAVGAGTATPPPPPPTECVVPGVVGMNLDAARAQIVDAGCLVGRIRRVRSDQVGIVLAQSPVAGTRLPQGGSVSLTVGRR